MITVPVIFYSSKISEHSNLRVRDWLNGQSYEKQYEFGLEVLKKYGYQYLITIFYYLCKKKKMKKITSAEEALHSFEDFTIKRGFALDADDFKT